MTSITADEFVRYLSWVLFSLLCLQTLVQFIRRPTPVNLNIALLFGVAATIIGISVLLLLQVMQPGPLSNAILSSGIVLLPFLLFRLIDDVIGIPQLLHRGVAAGFALSLAVIWLMPQNLPTWLVILLLLFLVGVYIYVIGRGIQATMRAHGITQRRLAAVTAGSLFLVLNFIMNVLSGVLPSLRDICRISADVLSLAAGGSYYLGFAPPGWLRRVWQEPELHAFLTRAARLVRLPDTAAIVQALEQGAADSLGAPQASIGLWHESHQLLRFSIGGAPFDVMPTSSLPPAVAFRTQKPIFSPNTRYEPAVDALFQLSRVARAVLAAPITAGDQRLGVLVAGAPRAPIFADDDLALIQLLADQAAVILESRRLIDESARVRAREEAARLKEDFLSAAAHDLKTPLTTILAQAQILDRRLTRNPDARIDPASVRRLVTESERLRTMVLELLDAARAEGGQLVGKREPVDLAALAHEIAGRHQSAHHPCAVRVSGPVQGMYDPLRIAQLMENLVENAIKYSPDGGTVTLTLWQDASGVHVQVADEGIGIPPQDLPHLFERFHRGSNTDDRRFPGMGLGLYICRAIVEEHGGTIAVESTPGEGTTFTITLPNTLIHLEQQRVEHLDR